MRNLYQRILNRKIFSNVKNHGDPDEQNFFYKKFTDQSIIFKKHLKIWFSAYYMLSQIASNEIFLVEIPNDISFLCVKYLTSADVGWSLPLIDKNQKFLKTTHIIYKTYQNSYHLKAWADLKYTKFFFKKFTDQSIKIP